MDTKAEFEKLSSAFASIFEKVKQAKADGMGEESEKEGPEMEDIMEMCGNLSRRIEYMASMFWDYSSQHQKGHTPPLKSASNVKAFLKACDMEDDYDVIKPSIFASASAKNGVVVTASYTKNK